MKGERKEKSLQRQNTENPGGEKLSAIKRRSISLLAATNGTKISAIINFMIHNYSIL